MKSWKISTCYAIDFVVWILVVYWVCSLLFFYGCRSRKEITSEQTTDSSTVIRDTLVSIPLPYDTFVVSLPLRDTVVASTVPWSAAKISIETKENRAKIVYAGDTVVVRLDSALRSSVVTRYVHDTKTVYRCDSKFHTFCVWFSCLAILFCLAVVTVRIFVAR